MGSYPWTTSRSSESRINAEIVYNSKGPCWWWWLWSGQHSLCCKDILPPLNKFEDLDESLVKWAKLNISTTIMLPTRRYLCDGSARRAGLIQLEDVNLYLTTFLSNLSPKNLTNGCEDDNPRTDMSVSSNSVGAPYLYTVCKRLYHRLTFPWTFPWTINSSCSFLSERKIEISSMFVFDWCFETVLLDEGTLCWRRSDASLVVIWAPEKIFFGILIQGWTMWFCISALWLTDLNVQLKKSKQLEWRKYNMGKGAWIQEGLKRTQM